MNKIGQIFLDIAVWGGSYMILEGIEYIVKAIIVFMGISTGINLDTIPQIVIAGVIAFFFAELYEGNKKRL